MSTINPADYPSNSHKPRTTTTAAPAEAEKRVKKVVKAPVTIKQKSEARKFLDNFISEDITNVKEYLVKDIVIPTIKDTIWAAITNSVEMVLFGSTGRSRRNGTSSSRRTSDYVSYSSFSSDRRDNRSYRERREEEESNRSRFDPEDIVFKYVDDAEAVLDQMAEVIEAYGKVTVNDLYDMVDRTPPAYTATRYGWTYLDGNCKPQRVRDGYILKLPKAKPL